MIDPTVSDFFTKNAESDYLAEYDRSHGPRLDAMISHFGLTSIKHQRVLDVGGGLGFLGKRLDPSNDYWVIDGATVSNDQKLCLGTWLRADLDHQSFGSGEDLYEHGRAYVHGKPLPFDIAFCLETLEHIGNPHHALVEIKKLVKEDALIMISIPTETVWHNAPYPSLLWPRQNFEQFLGQMALHIQAFWEYQPKSVGWPAYHYLCTNEPWDRKQLLFPKDEAKFRDCTPLQATNL